MTTRRKRGTPGDKTICIPVPEGVNYSEWVKDTETFRKYLNELIEEHRELFPVGIEEGYCFHGFVHSDKYDCETRRIRLRRNRDAYQLRPDFLMPYGIGKTEEVKKGLYLRRYGVPYDGIAHVLGHECNVLVASNPSDGTSVHCGKYSERHTSHSPLTWSRMKNIVGGWGIGFTLLQQQLRDVFSELHYHARRMPKGSPKPMGCLPLKPKRINQGIVPRL
jgi:hypothetical protein